MRFYNPTPREYQSTYVDTKLPYDFLLKSGAKAQEDVDLQYGKINALKKTIETLPVDSQEASIIQKQIDDQIDTLRSFEGDPRDNQFKRQLIESSRSINDLYNKANQAYGSRKQLAEDELKKIKEVKNLTQRQYLEKDYMNRYFNPQSVENAAQLDISSGKYKPLSTPDYFNYKEQIDQDLFSLAKDVDTDKIFSGYKAKNFDDFTKRWVEGTVETRDFDKILNSLYGYMQTPEVAKTLATERAVNYGEDFGQAFQQESQAFIKIKNKKGEEMLIPNPKTLSGQKVRSAIDARVTRKEDYDSDFIKDDLGLYKAKGKAEQELNAPTTNTVTIGTEGTGNFVDALPSELSEFYDRSGNLNFDVSVPVSKITMTSQGAIYPTDNKDPKAVKYAKNIIETAKSITGLDNEEFKNLYNKIGFKGVEDYTKSYYQNLSLVKNNIQQLQPQEEETFTKAFLGTDIKGIDKDDVAAGVNYRATKGRITDINGDLVKNEDISNKNAIVTGIDYNKPGMLVLAANDGVNYRLETTNQDLIRGTKGTSELKNDVLKYLKKPNKQPNDVVSEKIIKYQDGTDVLIQAIATRENGIPNVKIVASSQSKDGKIERVPLESNSIDDFEKYNTSKLLNSSSFRALIKQKEVKQEFEE
jgi:hypothetical protein